MDFELGAEQRLIQQEAREVLARHCASDAVRRWQAQTVARPPELWEQLAKLGWLGFAIPVEYGGLGADFLDLVLLHEECGRALVPTLFAGTTAAALAIVACGTPAQRDRYLPGIARGDSTDRLAVMEADAVYDLGRIRTRLERRAHGGTLTGRKLFVANGADADRLLVVTRDIAGHGAASGADVGLRLGVVERAAPGVGVRPLTTFGGEPAAEVVFDGVAIAEEALLGDAVDVTPALRTVEERRTVLLCGDMLGGFGRVLDLTTEYVKGREQFGRPIGSFQAVQHALADMAIALEGARYSTYQAAWRLARGLPAAREVAIAKAWTSPAYKQATLTAHQLHGGTGFVTEYDLHLYSSRAKACETMLGAADRHLERLAAGLLERR